MSAKYFQLSKRIENDIMRLVKKGKDAMEIAIILGKKQSFVLKCMEKMGIQ